MLEAIVFYLFGALVCAMFFIAVRSANVLYALSALACGMVGLSAFFFLMRAEFLGVVQIIVYSGAVVALYAFGMMFFNLSKSLKESKSFLAGILSLALVVLLSALVGYLAFENAPALENISENVLSAESQEAQSGLNNIQIFGYLVFTKYLIAFEVAAVLLLVAMVIGIVLIIKEGKKSSNIESARVDSQKE
ncbi:NADH-quinone oxidoreductase subunit J [Helicobacter sp. MIT 00-7814]|uniref:NADH-quinone oxidoreductase subunit J n=1 Tax=unclassified Helicobacter TaxID=2593540 RepID=UPI000E1EE7E1|nr:MULTISPECIES: NADH-quinone oxidoreductase subunit J [unclassified Helicobacter]RDU53922.1 NADH-quinone oxidoreductase subunit J [Helicobacter sp. MIT 00-7814]RDU57052.1 NADH-quinone oxidoreductase subunit J [Helicobacter sp. MIT 99-10781]